MISDAHANLSVRRRRFFPNFFDPPVWGVEGRGKSGMGPFDIAHPWFIIRSVSSSGKNRDIGSRLLAAPRRTARQLSQLLTKLSAIEIGMFCVH